ncbi:MAG: hypothetical protein ACFFG0_31410 [Candidatus Thorarchaeota archaeon]
MAKVKAPLNKKIRCPICSYEFIPEAFHIEKTHYEAIESKGELMQFLNKKHQVIIKPHSSLKGSWVTYCPECGFIIKFAVEVGKKEILQDPSLIEKLSGFKEFGKIYKYNFAHQEKPYMDYLDYFIQKVDNVKNKIKNALDEIDFTSWGNPYREWKHNKNFDAFKFLIQFYSNLEDYCNSQIEDYKNKDMTEKILKLNLPEELERLIQNIRALRNTIVHEVHEVTEEEENNIERTYIQFMSYLVMKHLKPLDLNHLEIEPDYDFIEIDKINHEIQSFLHLYLETTLGIKDFHNKFLAPLLKDLGISNIT